MRFLISILFLINYQIYPQITLTDIDKFRSITKPEEKSIIVSGIDFCNKFFNENKKIVISNNKNFKNFFMCKFSEKRNRLYIYMLSLLKEKDQSIKETCNNVIASWPWIFDHMDKNLNYQIKDYLKGFYIENIFNKKIINFTNNLKNDTRLINNEINNLILKNRDTFTADNKNNNIFLEKEINKLKKVYKKILSRDESDLDKIIKSQLDEIIRYKIFINDTKNFKSYSCNWKPGKGSTPYIRKEKFSEFENI